MKWLQDRQYAAARDLGRKMSPNTEPDPTEYPVLMYYAQSILHADMFDYCILAFRKEDLRDGKKTHWYRYFGKNTETETVYFEPSVCVHGNWYKEPS